jgi:hypothetical protein
MNLNKYEVGVGWKMNKKYALFAFSIILLIIIINFSVTSASDSVVLTSHGNGVVDKEAGDAFKVEVSFKNTGNTQGSWSVSVVFEGSSWIWKGTVQSLTLNAGATRTLVWNGVVPANAPINSIARLVVYYGDSFKALDWWIHVVPDAELAVTSSSVE